MVRGWDQASHEALLMALIEEIKPGKPVLTEVTKRMNAAGWPYSYDAIKYNLPRSTHTRTLHLHPADDHR